MTSPTTVQTPSASDTKQQVQLPAWANEAGQKAVGIASGIATTPYTPYGGSMVAPQSDTTTKAIDLSKSLGQVGQGAIDTGQDAATAATQLAKNSVGTGKGAIDTAGQLFGQAGGMASSPNPANTYLDKFSGLNNVGNLGALSSLNAGKSAVDTGANAASSLVPAAEGAVNAGQGDASAMSALARLTAGGALSSTGAGQGDLNSARGYTAGSATPISGADIASYMNPYIEQSLNPAVRAVTRQSDADRLAIEGEAGMRGAFGGSRQGLLEGANERNKLESIGNIYQTGFANAFDNASKMATDERSREAGAAGLSQGTAGQSGTLANDAISRLIQSGSQLGQAGTTQSNLATEGLNRVSNAATTSGQLGGEQSSNATEALNRLTGQENQALAGADTANTVRSSDIANLTSTGNAQSQLGQTQSQLASSDEDRLLASVNPNLQIAQTQFNNTTQQIQAMLQSGQIDQAQAQNQIDASYAQYLDQRQWAANQLNALISTLSGLPYSTQSTSNTTGFTTQAGASPLSQVAGAGIAAAGLGLKMSDRDTKTDIKPVDDEDVLRKLSSIDVSTYRYQPKFREAIGDDGQERIGPMAQDWSAHFGGPEKGIGMPQAIGALHAAVRALDKRTRPRLKKAA